MAVPEYLPHNISTLLNPHGNSNPAWHHAMFSADQYELLDFGGGRRLERFGLLVLDRPAPVADRLRCSQPKLWSQASGRYERQTRQRGDWQPRTLTGHSWQICHGPWHLELRCTDSAAIGVYPEQAENWDWIAQQTHCARRPLKVLNLFAYTGGSTLAAALAGAEVVHVDAVQSVVQWARRNAELSGSAAAPVRWIVEDVRKFVAREVRRGAQYDAVILDPPSYGHGPKAQPWKLEEHLEPLLDQVGLLTSQRRVFVLLTCHSPSYGPAELRELLVRCLGSGGQGPMIQAGQLSVQTRRSRSLPCGAMARWVSGDQQPAVGSTHQ